jgi:hypothetical protein
MLWRTMEVLSLKRCGLRIVLVLFKFKCHRSGRLGRWGRSIGELWGKVDERLVRSKVSKEVIRNSYTKRDPRLWRPKSCLVISLANQIKHR